ncbi:MAG: hypothetical protein K2Y37_14360 [Pirellulales bacterium]|nr:hypothetical protein [Pirellulales bacterium]
MRPTRWILPCCLATSLIAASSVALGAEASSDKLVMAVKAVGHNAQGNAAAAAAVAELSQASVDTLPRLLAAIDDANPLAANLLAGAVEAICDRQLAGGGKLPVAVLEKYVLDTAHQARSRRLAYELLLRVDASAADRLIPGLLNDVGLEFRRDAVARLITAGEADAKAEKADAAKATFAKALTAARDLDQVKLLAEKLKQLGSPIDLPTHFGLVLEWQAIGPFDNTDMKSFDTVYPPEEKVDLTASYPGPPGANGKPTQLRWKPVYSSEDLGLVDLNKGLTKANDVVGYVACQFDSDKEQDVDLRLATVNANKIWLNGKLLAVNEVYHAGNEFDQYVAAGRLKKGPNVILLKILQNKQPETWAQDWSFQFRVCDKIGTAVLAKNRPPRRPATTGEQASAAALR